MDFKELTKEVYKCKTNKEVNELLDKYLEGVERASKNKEKNKIHKKKRH